jgi:hypothetical protein
VSAILVNSARHFWIFAYGLYGRDRPADHRHPSASLVADARAAPSPQRQGNPLDSSGYQSVAGFLFGFQYRARSGVQRLVKEDSVVGPLLVLASLLVAAIVVASLPWWTRRIRIGVLTVQVIVSIALPLFFSTFFITWQIWTVVLAPGAVIALIRLLRALAGLPVEPRRH